MAKKWRVEAWTIDSPEEPCQEEMERAIEFDSEEEGMRWAWDRMEEGFATRLWRV